jgi:hypothetical protein
MARPDRRYTKEARGAQRGPTVCTLLVWSLALAIFRT